LRACKQTLILPFEKVMQLVKSQKNNRARRHFIGGSDARVIMSADEAALIRLWKEKRGEAEPGDLSGNLIVQLGVATETLIQTWYERNTGRVVTDARRWVQHPVHRYLAATLDGFVNELDAVFEAKFMLPWSFSEEAAAEKHRAQVQHNMWVTNARSSVLSIITGGGKWIEMTVPADALYQRFLVTAERRFWRCVQTAEIPRPYGVEPRRPRIEAVRVVDMSESNSWAFRCTALSSGLDIVREALGGYEIATVQVGGFVGGFQLAEVGEQSFAHRIRLVWSQNGPRRTIYQPDSPSGIPPRRINHPEIVSGAPCFSGPLNFGASAKSGASRSSSTAIPQG
jgi:hypothetical protein